MKNKYVLTCRALVASLVLFVVLLSSHAAFACQWTLGGPDGPPMGSTVTYPENNFITAVPKTYGDTGPTYFVVMQDYFCGGACGEPEEGKTCRPANDVVDEGGGVWSNVCECRPPRI